MTPATIDFETYSEAGFIWDEPTRKWLPPVGSKKKGLKAVGVGAYATHPTTEVLVLCYRLPDGSKYRWLPGDPPPQPLFDHIAAGGMVEAHNIMFDRMIWHYVCHLRMGWPLLPPAQLQCSMAAANVCNLPPGLDALGDALHLNLRKDKEGKRLLRKFSIPRNPTKSDDRTRIRP